MKNFENNSGYYPEQDVYQKLVSLANPDIRLLGLWPDIGNKIICINYPGMPPISREEIIEMFSEDPIAVELMRRIICYNRSATEIVICAVNKSVEEYIASNGRKFPVEISAEGSHFDVVLSHETDRSITNVCIWKI